MTSSPLSLRAVPSLAALLVTASLAATGCAPDSPGGADEHADDGHEHESPEPAETASDALTAGSVEKAAREGCSTGAVKKLSLQIIEEARCIEPDSYVPLPSRPNLTVESVVFPYLEAPARAKLVAALDANPNKRMTVNSMLRTVAQQYMLRKWDLQGRCGIKVAAVPGNSNHETGLAIDIQESSSWRSALQSRGFRWLGSGDPVHYDYVGSGAVDHRGLDVLAFQRLWNRNNPDDTIAEDGDWGPDTEARMKKAPAAGFRHGPECQENGDDEDIAGGGEDPEPTPEESTCDACTAGPRLPASCSTCVADVCAVDAYCCDNAWDEACARLAGETAGCGCGG
jgi:hypothetical protein